MSQTLITVATFSDSLTANLARNRLADEGIPAYIADENTTGTVWYLSNALGWVKLQVAEVDAIRARELLETAPGEPSSEPAEDPPIADDEVMAAPNAREQNALRALRGAVFGLLLPPLLFYVLWLLIKINMSGEPLSRRGQRSAAFATVITLSMLALWTWLFTEGQYSR